MSQATRKQIVVLASSLSAGFLLIGALVLIGLMAPSTHDYDSLVMSRLAACPQAVEALGEPLTNQLWGMAPGGSMRLRGEFGEVDWSDPVGGSKGRGYYHYVLEKRGGPWTLLRAELSVGEKQIDILSCAKAANKH
jgi:hypothetical protein